MSKNLIARIAVAAVFIPAILWVCYQGGVWLLGMLTLFALIGIIEFMIGEKYQIGSPTFVLTFFFAGAWFAQFFLLLVWRGTQTFILTAPMFILGFFLISSMTLATRTESPDALMSRLSRLTWGVLYICILYPTVFAVSYCGPWLYDHSGGNMLLYLFGILWIGDTAAMGIGAWIGKHKLAPTVSPNKTIEGFIGGIVGAIAVGIVMYFWKLENLGLVHVLVLAIGCSIFGQLGDLVESMWKRSVGIKDSSAIIPGHGGVLDRFDSLLFAAPFMFFYLEIFFG